MFTLAGVVPMQDIVDANICCFIVYYKLEVDYCVSSQWGGAYRYV
jgi:hypothetical protein